MNQFSIGDDSAWAHIASPQEPEISYISLFGYSKC